MSSKSSQLELDENDLWGNEDVQSVAPSDSEESDVEGEAVSNGAAAASSDDSSSSSSDGDIDAELAQAADLRRSTSSGATSGSMPGPTAAAAAALAAAHPGMAAGSDANVSLTRAIPGSAGRRRTLSGLAPPRTRAEAAMAEAAAKLGSSVPIAIPMAQRGEPQRDPDSPLVHGSMRAATFVPPHLLDHQPGGFHAVSNSVHGTSPAASLKRERLVSRNAILRRTGFLEDSRGVAFLETMDPIRESAMEIPVGRSYSPSLSVGSPGHGSFSNPSALSLAFKPAGA
mmetsp:Transcript_13218/g.40067  ORF Transcript_13218/g.40067 Transcript_13218/m.40067 type:complete len:285 (-) Transcript_13218:1082-1936(-)